MAILKSGAEELIRHYRNKKTRSFSYIMPLLTLHREDIFVDKYGSYSSNKDSSLFLNCFAKDEAYPDLDNHIFLLYKFFGSREFMQFEKRLQTHPYYVDMYDPYSNMVMFMFEVPPTVKSDYDLLLKGQYSKITDASKNKIIDFHDLRGLGGKAKITQILYRLEAAYVDNEEAMNKGLPPREWVRIPRTQEATSVMDIEGDETFKHISTEDKIQGNKRAENITGFGEEEE